MAQKSKQPMPDESRNRVFKVSNLPIHSWRHEDVLKEISRNIQDPRESLYIAITSTDSMYYARRDPAHRKYIENARLSLCDGIGLVIVARLQGKRVRRFTGPVLMIKCCQYGVERGWRHFFCGGREGVADQLAARLSLEFPGLITAGTFCPPFREMSSIEEAEMIRKINEAQPDILWVGLGVVKQEAWIARYIDRIRVPWCVGVGAAFDFHAGVTPWAPSWIQRIGMEWVYRWCMEPKTISKRSIKTLTSVFDGIRESFSPKTPP